MEAWADCETASAPAMYPTAEMYRMVQARRRRGLPFLLPTHRVALATAAASLAFLALLCVRIVDPLGLFPPPVRHVTVVALRAGFPSEKGIVERPTVGPARNGPKGQVAFFERLSFQFQQSDSRFVIAVDVRGPQEESIVLTSADNYRLVLEPTDDGCVYVFQLTSSDSLVQLFPNEAYHPARNPLLQGQTYYLPAEPNWFYLGEGAGEERLHIIAAHEPVPELERLYASYSQATGTRERQRLRSSLLEVLHSMERIRDGETAGWVFAFQHR
jgi:hypothetical protein